MKIVRMNMGMHTEETVGKDEILVVQRNNPIRRSFIDRALFPTHILRDVFVEDRNGKFLVCFVCDKQGIFRTTRKVSYLDCCFPGGDPFTKYFDTEQEAVEVAIKYKEQIGHPIYV